MAVASLNTVYINAGLASCFAGIVGAAMSNAPLSAGTAPSARVQALIRESKAKNCPYMSAIPESNPLKESDIADAVNYIRKNPDYSSYFLLYALSKYYPKAYADLPSDNKITVLCSALKNVSSLNSFGALGPGPNLEDCGELLVKTGKDAIGRLKPLLDDDGSAMLWGSESATDSLRGKYRRKDYAYRYISMILDRPRSYSRDPKERDKMIDELKEWLKKKPK